MIVGIGIPVLMSLVRSLNSLQNWAMFTPRYKSAIKTEKKPYESSCETESQRKKYSVLPDQVKGLKEEKGSLFQLQYTFEELHSTAWPPSWMPMRQQSQVLSQVTLRDLRTRGFPCHKALGGFPGIVNHISIFYSRFELLWELHRNQTVCLRKCRFCIQR